MQQACFDSHAIKSKFDSDRQCSPSETRQEPEVSTHMRTKVGVQHAEIKDEPTDVVITAQTDSYSYAESDTPHPATPAASYETWEPGNSSDTICIRAASMPQGAVSNSDSDTLDVPLPAFPSSQPSSVTTQHPTAAKSKSNSSLSSESVFVGNMEDTADLSLESHTITNVTQTSRVKHGLIREGDQAAINTPQMSEVLKKIASVAQKQNMVGNMENTAESGVNSNIHVPNFSHSTQVYRGVHKIQSSKNYKDGRFPCEICKTCGFRSRHDLKMHMRQHEDEKLNKCSHYQSKHNATLKLHLAHQHSNAKPFHCPVFSRPRKSSSAFGKHKIVHSGKK